MFKSILVLESIWDSTTVKSKSVWPFVSEFANVNGINAYHQVFTDKDSFCHWIKLFDKERATKPKLLYIATHGNIARISGLNHEINFNTILSEIRKTKTIQYVHFGTCYIGNPENLKLLLEKSKKVTMVSGYNKEVDWIDSTLFDIMLWGRIISRENNDKGKKSHSVVKDFVSEEVLGLADNLGFQFAYRYGDRIFEGNE